MNYKFRESYNLGNEDIEVEVKGFDTKKEAREYMNSRVKEVKTNNKEWKTYYQDSSDFFSEKELRLKSEIKKEEEGTFDIGESKIYYAFEIELIG